MMIGGVDDKPELYMIDFMGSFVPEEYGAMGVGSHFTYAMMDKYWHTDMEKEEAIELMNKLIAEVQKRVAVASLHYSIQICYKDRTEVIKGPEPFPPVN